MLASGRAVRYTNREKLLSFSQVELLIHEIAVRPDIWIGARLCEQVLASLCGSDS